MKKILFSSTVMLITTLSVYAQANASAAENAAATGVSYQTTMMWLILAATVIVVLVSVLLMSKIASLITHLQENYIYKEKGIEKPAPAVKTASVYDSLNLWQRLSNRVPVEYEEDIMLDHNYDGIRELDNRLPPWWVALFYGCIIWGFGYMVYYHFGGWGKSNIELYQEEVLMAETRRAEVMALKAEEISESTVAALTDKGQLEEGKTIFMNNCKACHGEKGEGIVGPNLTDENWIHGGGIKNVFKVIKEGVPAKGMISWKDQLRLTDIQKVASYILTLKGTNPPNGKAPEGEVYNEEETTAPADTTATEAGK
jgi:cytochrome c oxidase cbb3-type subunit 3